MQFFFFLLVLLTNTTEEKPKKVKKAAAEKKVDDKQSTLDSLAFGKRKADSDDESIKKGAFHIRRNLSII